MDLVRKITETISPSLDAMGYALVQVKLSDGKHKKTLTVMAERKDAQSMGFDDCTEISRQVGALLEVEDPISSAYDLEICSPGLDRPLVKMDDFIRHAGFEIKLETQLPIDGRRRFRGNICGVEDGRIMLAMQEGETQIDFANVRSAKLVVNDALVAAHLKKKY